MQGESVAGTSSFGMSGVNAHAVLSPAEPPHTADRQPSLLWHRLRHWFAPAQHAMLVRCTAARGKIAMSTRLGSASMAYLHDHQVQGRALCAGAAMFEMGAAAGASLLPASSGPRLILSEASIAAPCQLNVPELSCLISGREGTLNIKSSATHMSGSFSQAPSAPYTAIGQGLKAAGSNQVASMLRCKHTVQADEPRPPANFGHAATPDQETAGYRVHPALGDACIHLAAVPSSSASIPLRVPVAVGAFGGSTGQPGMSSGWACAQPDMTLPDASTTNHMRWLGSTGASLMEVAGLHAKVMPAPRPAAGAAKSERQAGISYEVQWQAALACVGSRQASSWTGAVWEAFSKHRAQRAQRMATRPAKRPAAACAALMSSQTAAKRHLRCLQAMLTSRDASHISLAAELQCRRGLSICTGSSALVAASAFALAKVAAAEHTGPGAPSFSSYGMSSHACASSQPGMVPHQDVHGPCMDSNIWHSPRLLPIQAQQSSHQDSVRVYTATQIIITGGLGALGSLVGAWLLAAMPASTGTCVTLLGRSGRPSQRDTSQTLVRAQQQGCLRLAMCDIACSADASSLMSATAQGWLPPASSLIHAGGVLKASPSSRICAYFCSLDCPCCRHMRLL